MVIDEPAVVVAPPAAVFEHGFADGARESGHLIPGGGEAGGCESGDKTLCAASRQCSAADAAAGGDVVGECDVTRGVDVSRRRVHVLVDDDASVASFQPGRFGQPDVGPYTGRGDDEVRLDRRAVVEHHAGLVDFGHSRLTDEADAVVGQDLDHAFTGLEAETSLQGNGFRGHERGCHAAGREAGGGLTADQASADDDR